MGRNRGELHADCSLANKRRNRYTAKRYGPSAQLPRPNSPKDEGLTANELKELQRRLSLLSPSHVEDFYREAHRACYLNDKTFPVARAIQQLVQAWNN
jgi:hypothetical protein